MHQKCVHERVNEPHLSYFTWLGVALELPAAQDAHFSHCQAFISCAGATVSSRPYTVEVRLHVAVRWLAFQFLVDHQSTWAS